MTNNLKKILLLLIFSASLFYFWKSGNFLEKKVSIQEEIRKSSLLGDLLSDSNTQVEIQQPIDLVEKVSVEEVSVEEVSEEEVRVLPITISDNSTLETEERAEEFSLLKSKCPIDENTFKINFSYKNDNFDVFVVADKQDEFWQWLKLNYPKLEKDSFTIIEL